MNWFWAMSSLERCVEAWRGLSGPEKLRWAAIISFPSQHQLQKTVWDHQAADHTAPRMSTKLCCHMLLGSPWQQKQ